MIRGVSFPLSRRGWTLPPRTSTDNLQPTLLQVVGWHTQTRTDTDRHGLAETGTNKHTQTAMKDISADRHRQTRNVHLSGLKWTVNNVWEGHGQGNYDGGSLPHWRANRSFYLGTGPKEWSNLVALSQSVSRFPCSKFGCFAVFWAYSEQQEKCFLLLERSHKFKTYQKLIPKDSKGVLKVEKKGFKFRYKTQK